MTQIVQIRLQEIRQRSRNVESRWALSASSQSGFGTLAATTRRGGGGDTQTIGDLSVAEQVVDTSNNVISALDFCDIREPKALLDLYQDVFSVRVADRVDAQKETLLRVRTCLDWAVTTEREGSGRAL